jgi:NADP-dependent 3-hydroxy acid dehydrogenase YdfG
MIQPQDIADCVWLVVTLPSRAIVEEISMSSR